MFLYFNLYLYSKQCKNKMFHLFRLARRTKVCILFILTSLLSTYNAKSDQRQTINPVSLPKAV